MEGGERKKRIKEIQHDGKRKGIRAFVVDPFPPPPDSSYDIFALSFCLLGKAGGPDLDRVSDIVLEYSRSRCM